MKFHLVLVTIANTEKQRPENKLASVSKDVGKGSPHSLAVGLQTDVATVEVSVKYAHRAKSITGPAVVAHVFNPRREEAEAGGSL